MQQPTITNVRVRSVEDANKIFHAVHCGVLGMISRRLGSEERSNMNPGDVFIWEERGAQSESAGMGIERWTDGRSWGPSRVRDDFLFYHEKPQDEQPRSRSARNRAVGAQVRTERWVKQTYSVNVLDDADTTNPPRKWHMTAYWTSETDSYLRQVSHVPELRSIVVPPGMYVKARQQNKPRREERRSAAGSPGVRASSSTPESPSSPNAIYVPYAHSGPGPQRTATRHRPVAPYPRHSSPSSSSSVSPVLRPALPSLARPVHPSLPYSQPLDAELDALHHSPPPPLPRRLPAYSPLPEPAKRDTMSRPVRRAVDEAMLRMFSGITVR